MTSTKHLNANNNPVKTGVNNPMPTTVYDANSNPVNYSQTVPVIQTSSYPSGATALSASSGNVANSTATATLAGAASKVTYICGFTVHGGGATAASLIDVTVTGPTGGTMTYTFGVVAGATAPCTGLNISFNPPIPASAANTAIVVSAPAFGSGNTKATVNAYGYQL